MMILEGKDIKKSLEEIVKIFKEVNEEGLTVFLVTHDAKVAAEAQRVLFMKDGVIVDEIINKGDGYDTLLSKMKELNI